MRGHVATWSRQPAISAIRLALAAVAPAGVGAAITTAVWTDAVQFAAGAGASTFDIQGRFAVDAEWEDVGLLGDPATFGGHVRLARRRLGLHGRRCLA